MKKLLSLFLLTIGYVAIPFQSVLPTHLFCLFSVLGYMSVPLFADLLLTGFNHTKNTYIYGLRIGILAFLTQSIRTGGFAVTGNATFALTLNGAFSLLFSLCIITGMEILLSLPKDRVASMNLINANPISKSTRYGVIVSGSDVNHMPPGLKLPKLPRSSIHMLSILMILICIVLPLFLPLEFGFLPILCVVILFIVNRWAEKKLVYALLFFAIVAGAYCYTLYHFTGTWSLEWTAIGGIPLCYLLPEGKKPNPIVSRLLYFYYPLLFIALFVILFVA